MLGVMGPGQSMGQGTVLWQSIQPAPQRPAGTVWSYVNGSVDTGLPQYTPSTQGLTSISAEESGRDWWASHENVYDEEGELIGIVACGWSFPANWTYTNDCHTGSISGAPNPSFQETYESRWGEIRQIVGFFSPSGVLQWFRFLDSGVAYGVTVDREGYLIVVGEANNHEPFPETGATTSYVNPTPGDLVTMASQACPTAAQMTIAKLDQTGNVLWHNFYNTESNISSALTQRCVGQQVVETNTNNEPGYRVVGWQVSGGSRRACMVQVDADGMLQFATRFNSIPGISHASNGFEMAMYISRCPFGAGEKFAVTGFRGVPDNNNRLSAWVMYMDDAVGTVTDAEWTQDVYDAYADDGNPFEVDIALETCVNRVALTMDGSQPRVVWPLLYNYVKKDGSGQSLTAATPFATTQNREASARVFKFDGANGNILWGSPELGPMRAFDLFFSVKPMPSGDYAVTTTKAAQGHGIDDPLDYSDLAGGVQTCLTSSTGLGYDPDGPTLPGQPVNWAGLGWNSYGHHGTDSYVAILRNGTGSVVWQYQWDEGSGPVATTCYPENYRQRQCDFEITVDPAGDLIVCGNTGHNKDDCYLAKVQPSCDANADYSYFEEHFPLDANNEYHITSSVTWNTSMNVRGSIVIEPGGVLTITGQNTVIHFADSRKMGYTCNIVVKNRTGSVNAGDLVVTNQATITSLDECPESMWDGVRLLGNGNGNTSNDIQWKQGEVYVINGGAIHNALVALTNCQVDPTDPVNAAASDIGGIVKIDDAVFKNNRYAVVMRAYPSPNTTDATATSYFYNSDLLTTSPLNYTDLHPETFLWFDKGNRMSIGGNTFANQVSWNDLPAGERGTGVYARGTSIWVMAMCGQNDVWNTSCALQNIGAPNTFTDLDHGIQYIQTLSGRQIRVYDAVVNDCGGGIRAEGGPALCWLLRNNIRVPSRDYTAAGIDAAYGFGIWGETANFKVENNLVEGTDMGEAEPTVGAIFDNTGNNAKRYYNNTFNYLRFGTLIQGDNDGSSTGDGLEIKCNDYGITEEEGENQYDVVFAGEGPSVGDRQGSPAGNSDSPAGNRFSPDCYSAETNMFVPNASVNTFTYWHHATSQNWQLIPQCRTNPPIAGSWLVNTQVFFDKDESCPGYIPLVGSGGPEMMRMAQSGEAHEELLETYDSQRDGGETEDLKTYVAAAINTSGDVRDALLAKAPEVSTETWTEVFQRAEPLNSWHLTQALVANSPLQPEVLGLMEQSGLDAFYTALVYEAQSGVNGQTVLESEMGYWKHAHAEALYRLFGAALDEGTEVSLEDVLEQEAAHNEFGLPWVRIAALIAQGQRTEALALVDAVRGATPHAGLEVLSLRLAAEENAPDAAVIERLQELAAEDGPGMFPARAWLKELGLADHPERILLPMQLRSAAGGSTSPATGTDSGLLSAYPNPSDGRQPVYLVTRLLDGMGQAEVRVYDPLGRQVLVQRLTSAVGIAELPARGLVPGLYHAQLVADGMRVAMVKFEVIR